MVQCWAPQCKHYSNRETCKFFRFPQKDTVKTRWINLLMKDIPPGPNSRVCSCHFLNGIKENGPILYEHKPDSIEQNIKKQKTKNKPALHQQASPSNQKNYARIPKPRVPVTDALNLSHFPAAQIRYWQMKKRQRELEEAQQRQQNEAGRTEENLLDLKEELIEVEETQLVDIKEEPLDEVEYILSDDPLSVQIKEEPEETDNQQTIAIGKNIDANQIDSMFINFATRFKLLSTKAQLRIEAKISQILDDAELEDQSGTSERRQSDS